MCILVGFIKPEVIEFTLVLFKVGTEPCSKDLKAFNFTKLVWLASLCYESPYLQANLNPEQCSSSNSLQIR